MPVLAGPRARLSIVPDSDLPDSDQPDAFEASGVPALDLRAEIAFDDILRRATPKLVRFAQRRLGNLHEAEEVAQEALLRTFQNRHKLATEDDVMAWATFVTSRLVIDRVRVRGRSISMADVPEDRRTSPDTASIAEARADARIALDALDALPGRQASVLWAREVEGLRYDEIGARFGLSEPTVRSLLHRGRKALRREYSLRGGTIPVGGVAILGPWLWPIKHAHRLRNAAVTIISTTALGVLSLGLFTLGTPSMSLPSNAKPVTAEVRAAVARTHPAALGSALSQAAPVMGHAVSPPATATTATSATSATVATVCSGRIGVNCRPDATPNRVWVRIPGTRIGTYVGNYDAPCESLPTNPVAGCDHGGMSTPTSTSRSGAVR